MRHPLPQSSSRPACPLSLCQNQQKSRALCAQRRVFRRAGEGHEQKGSVANRTPTWLKLVGRAEPKAGPSVPARPQGAESGSPSRLSPSTWDRPRGNAPQAAVPPRASRQDQLGLRAPSPRWGHLRLLGRTEASEGGGSGYLLDASIDV